MMNKIIQNFSATLGSSRSRRWRMISILARKRNNRALAMGIAVDQAIKAGLFTEHRSVLEYISGGGIKFYSRKKRKIQKELMIRLFVSYLEDFPDGVATVKMVQQYLLIRKELRMVALSLKVMRYFFGDWLSTKKIILTDKGFQMLQFMIASKNWKQLVRRRNEKIERPYFPVTHHPLYLLLVERAEKLLKLVPFMRNILWMGKYQAPELAIERLRTFPMVDSGLFGFRQLSASDLKRFDSATLLRIFNVSSTLLLKNRTTYSAGLPLKVGVTIVLEMNIDGNVMFNTMEWLEDDFWMRQRPSILLPSVASEIPDDVIGRPIYEDPANAKELLESMAKDWGYANDSTFTR